LVNYAAINAKADARKATHTQRAAALTRSHFEAHPELAVDTDVDSRCWRDWWLDASLWEGLGDDWYTGRVRRKYEILALDAIARAAGTILKNTITHEREPIETKYLNRALDDMRGVYLDYLTLRQLHRLRHQVLDFIPIGDKMDNPRRQRYKAVLRAA
jgi:hypothetical protein